MIIPHSSNLDKKQMSWFNNIIITHLIIIIIILFVRAKHKPDVIKFYFPIIASSFIFLTLLQCDLFAADVISKKSVWWKKKVNLYRADSQQNNSVNAYDDIHVTCRPLGNIRTLTSKSERVGELMETNSHRRDILWVCFSKSH